MTATQTRKLMILQMREGLAANAILRERSVQVLLERQTAEERTSKLTRETNGIGFNKFDAEILTSFAEQVNANRWNRPLGGRLTANQHRVLIRKLPKYAAQLVAVSAERKRTKWFAVPQTELVAG